MKNKKPNDLQVLLGYAGSQRGLEHLRGDMNHAI